MDPYVVLLHKLGSTQLCRMSWYAEVLKFPFTGIKRLKPCSSMIHSTQLLEDMLWSFIGVEDL